MRSAHAPACLTLAGGSFQGFGSLAASTPFLGIILLGIVLAWLAAARSLNTQFVALAENDEELRQEAGV